MQKMDEAFLTPREEEKRCLSPDWRQQLGDAFHWIVANMKSRRKAKNSAKAVKAIRKSGLSEEHIMEWLDALGVVNKYRNTGRWRIRQIKDAQRRKRLSKTMVAPKKLDKYIMDRLKALEKKDGKYLSVAAFIGKLRKTKAKKKYSFGKYLMMLEHLEKCQRLHLEVLILPHQHKKPQEYQLVVCSGKRPKIDESAASAKKAKKPKKKMTIREIEIKKAKTALKKRKITVGQTENRIRKLREKMMREKKLKDDQSVFGPKQA